MQGVVTTRSFRLLPRYRVSPVEMQPAVNISKRAFMNEWGERCEIVDLLDADGDVLDMDDPEQVDMARVAVAKHPLAEGGFYCVPLDDYEFDARGTVQ